MAYSKVSKSNLFNLNYKNIKELILLDYIL